MLLKIVSTKKYQINICTSKRRPPMTLRTINLNLELGQTILVGQNDEPAQITKIEFHEQSGEIAINTTRGPRKVLTFKLCHPEDDETHENPADRYR
jgi:hypothetical protein